MNDDPNDPDLFLPKELLWASGGHASDVVLTALADGQHAIVPGDVRVHVDRCPACMAHLGHAALLSLHAGAELLVRAEHDRSVATTRQPLPRLPIALGLAVAALGLVPSLFDGESQSAAARSFFTREVPLFVRGLGTLVGRLDAPGSSAGLFVPYAAAGLLICMGLAAVRLLPKKEEVPR